MGHGQSKRDRAREQRRKQRNIASEESKAKEIRVWQILARHFAHFLKLFRPPLCHLHRYTSSPAPSTYMLHVVTTNIYLHISGYSSARGILCACVFLVKYSRHWQSCSVPWQSSKSAVCCLLRLIYTQVHPIMMNHLTSTLFPLLLWASTG